MQNLLTLILVGLSVGLDNFAASIAIGLGGVAAKDRLKIALVFGAFETLMPLLGLLLGQGLASKLGGHANLFGGSLLILAGLYFVGNAIAKPGETKKSGATSSWSKLLFSGLSISIDNLIVGFSLGTRHVSLIGAVIAIGVCSISFCLLGLEFGARLGKNIEAYSEILSGLILAVVGIAIATKIL